MGGFARGLYTLWVVVLTVICAVAGSCNDSAAILKTGFTGEDSKVIKAVIQQIKSAGYSVSIISSDDLCDPAVLNPKTLDLLVIPNSATLPMNAVTSVQGFLRGGGDIIALNTPMWQFPIIKIDGKWTTRENFSRQHAQELPKNIVATFDPQKLDEWTRTTDKMSNPTKLDVTTGPQNSGALHAVIPVLTSWDTLVSPSLDNPFAGGKTLTVFSAKGGTNTNSLAIEWSEKDGSRWIATIPLTQEWRRYILVPSDFKYWTSVPTRGFPGDMLKPENAEKISIGLAQTHTGGAIGVQEYWIGPIGTEIATPDIANLSGISNIPAIDTLSPPYKLFDTTTAVKLNPLASSMTTSLASVKVSKLLRSPHPRPGGGGFDKGRVWRWIPLMEARSKDGVWRGTPITCTVNADGDYKNGVWLSAGIPDSITMLNPSVLKTIGKTAARMRDGLFILDGGSAFYTYFDDQQIKLGMRVVNVGKTTRSGLVARVTLIDPKAGTTLFSKDWPLSIAPGQTVSVSDSMTPDSWPADGFKVRAELLLGGKVIDRVGHDVNVYQPKSVKHYVTVKNANFILDGKRWRAHGVNYMPSSGIGIEDGPYFEYWIGARSYDPEVIERDLSHLQDMGINAVAIFMHYTSNQDMNLLDILRRLDKRGMKANVSLRPGTPFDFEWNHISEMIKTYRLWDNDTVFAYDLAWEPSFGSQQERVRWDKDWESWVAERYGSVANAEKDWGYAIPRDAAGTVTNPGPAQIDTNGDWFRMTAAYRRFLDTLLYKKYGEARRLVRTLDPNHHVSFRMSEAGNPDYRWDGRIAYDFPYLASAVDFLAPEAYGRIGDWEKVKPGWFETTYARWAAPNKPCIWAEMGVSTWDNSRMQNTQSKLDFQEMFHKAFYKLLISTGTDGVFFWWYPGGFRYGENSDYGIINPDGTDKPVSKVIRDNAKLFIDGPDKPKPAFMIEIDRDTHPDGIAGLHDEFKGIFWQKISEGVEPGFKTTGTGTDSANCPLIAVGNNPCSGSNPPKYLDAVFDTVEIKNASGKWVSVAKGSKIEVDSNALVVARINITNLGEAYLLASVSGNATGKVFITSTFATGQMTTPLQSDLLHQSSTELSDVRLTSSAFGDPIDVEISFLALDRTPFGEKFKITLVPADYYINGPVQE